MVDVRVPVNGMVADSRHDGTHVNGGGTHVEYSTCVAFRVEPSGATVPVMVIEQ